MRQAPAYITRRLHRELDPGLSVHWARDSWEVRHGGRVAGVVTLPGGQPLRQLDGNGDYVVALVRSWDVEGLRRDPRRGLRQMSLDRASRQAAEQEALAEACSLETRKVAQVVKQGGASPFLPPLT